MGLGMQIIYQDLPGTASLEAEAAVQLLRLQPFGAVFSDFRLTIGRVSEHIGNGSYDVCLEITTVVGRTRRIGRCIRESDEDAIRCAFNRGVRVLHAVTPGWR
ncbi:hypothetical protein BZM27_40680 [Paraburkholderia steynii]|uniref:Uncharacterized protein n=1 Tax=Paraburkholderia steynii TaxID=1245441 RepID=A0A4R0XA46_9BURK|nr:hypothetical protein BZM27_40680 [Paraburkholderia steynii]